MYWRHNMRYHLFRLAIFLIGLAVTLLVPRVGSGDEVDSAGPQVLVVVGAAGSDEYRSQFDVWADRWRATATSIDGATFQEIGRGESGDSSDKDLLHSAVTKMSGRANEAVWIVLIGHGTFDGKTAKFNLRGPDVSAEELSSWTAALKSPLIVVNCASSSGPFINRISGERRIVVTATKSGQEQNFARFGDYLSHAISDIAADLDHDDEVSLLEAFLSASGQVAKFYEAEDRIATEHALIDDNGDQRGTPATLFQGTKAVQATKDGLVSDGPSAARRVIFRSPGGINLDPQQTQQRDAVESEIDQLLQKKSELPIDEYFAQLEQQMLKIAALYAAAEAKQKDETTPGN